MSETTDCNTLAVGGGVDDWMVLWGDQRDGSTVWDVKGRVLFADIMKDGFESNDTTRWSSTVP